MSFEDSAAVLGWTNPTGMLFWWKAAPQTTTSSISHICAQAAVRNRMTALSLQSSPSQHLACSIGHQVQRSVLWAIFSQKARRLSQITMQTFCIPHLCLNVPSHWDCVPDYPANSKGQRLRKGTKPIKNDTGKLLGTFTPLMPLMEALHILSSLQNM